MDFLEAAEIAKSHLGSTLQRGESGLFVVKMKDGRVISTPEQLSGVGGVSSKAEHLDVAARIARLERLIDGQNRQREIDRQEIDQLRIEVNSLKKAIAAIPKSEWSRFEEEHKKIEVARQNAEARRLVGLARSGRLNYDQLNLVADNAGRLGIGGEDLKFIRNEIFRKRSTSALSSDSYVIHSIDD